MVRLGFKDSLGKSGTNDDGHPGKIIAVSQYFEGWLEISVTTHGARSHGYVAHLRAQDFEALAKEMVCVNPEAVIKAFGAAMQEASLPKPKQDSSNA